MPWPYPAESKKTAGTRSKGGVGDTESTAHEATHDGQGDGATGTTATTGTTTTTGGEGYERCHKSDVGRDRSGSPCGTSNMANTPKKPRMTIADLEGGA